jgi:hypothetical protein
MNDIKSGAIVWLVAAIAFISILSIIPAPAEAASAHDEFAASIDGGKLPPCPSLFKCRVE